MTSARADLPVPADPPAVVRIGSPPEICQAVPYLVGFEPERSVVVLSLRGERKRVGLVMRVDLPAARHARRLASVLVGHLVNDGAHAAVLVVYADRGSTSADRVGRAVLHELRRANIPVEEGLRVSDGLWMSYTCSLGCCPPTGTPLPDRNREPTAFGAAMVAEGRQVLPSRAALVATLDTVTGLLAQSMTVALLEQVEWPPDEPADAVAAYAATTVELAREWSARLADPRASLTVDGAARLLVGLTDRDVRDAVLPWWVEGVPTARLGPGSGILWTELIRRAVVPGLVAPPATLLAWYSYLTDGDGALAGIAAEKALADQPDYVMASNLLVLLERGVSPRRFEEWIRDSQEAPDDMEPPSDDAVAPVP